MTPISSEVGVGNSPCSKKNVTDETSDTRNKPKALSSAVTQPNMCWIGDACITDTRCKKNQFSAM
jgi:hypothetical protein